MAYLRGELMLQLAQSDQHFYHDGRMLEWLSGGLKLPCTYRQIVSNAIEDSRPLRLRTFRPAIRSGFADSVRQPWDFE